MDREHALESLIKIRRFCFNDPEVAHCDADEVLRRLLKSLGYSDVVDAWDSIEPKWYA